MSKELHKAIKKRSRLRNIFLKHIIYSHDIITFHFRKTSGNEVEKIINNLDIKKSCQQEDILTKITKLNKDMIAKFIAQNFNSCIDEGEFCS